MRESFINAHFATVLLALVLAPLRGAEAPDAFLDRRMAEPPEITSFVYLDFVKELQAVTPRPVIFPDGFMAFVTRRSPTLSGCFGQTYSRDAFTLRDYLNDARMNLHLAWRYDAARDAIVMDFPWLRPVTHPAGELLGALVADAPPSGQSPRYQTERWQHWTDAFDELLSRPENVAAAGKARLLQDCLSDSMADFLRVPVHAACISDVAGRRHLLVLIVSLPLTIPGPPPTFVGYLFDGEGRLEDSGIFAGGAALNVPTVQPATDGRALLVGLTIHETLGFGCTVGHDGGRPTLDEWGEWNWGRPSIGYDSSDGSVWLRLNSIRDIRYELRLGIEGGRLKPTFSENGAPMVPPGHGWAPLGPFRDSLD